MSTIVTPQTAACVALPGRPAPALDVELVAGGRFRLAERHPEHFTMLVFYRGNHCPVCRAQLRDLDRRIDEFAAHGVEVVALSADDRARAERSRDEWPVERVPLGFGAGIDALRAWGLYISNAYGPDMPERFGEPGVFLVASDGTLRYAAVTSTPFGRPRAEDLLAGIDYLVRRPATTFGQA